ncbi:MAG TPA: SRPBCC family protein, partial [Chloroflexota bacterium]|nr:SRPBCC family protein [Chloroflexota bacterium]
MEFENSFSVAAPLEQVWTYLLDVKAVAPCVPGAELTEIVSDTEFKGAVKIKLGAVQVNYRGTVVLKEVDNEAHRVVIVATGSETRGTGSASGTVTSTAVQDGQRTTVRMLSEIVVTGRVAQFGRNIMQDVSSKLIKDFAACVEAHLKKPDVEQPAVADVS